jgi:hypothetical protein
MALKRYSLELILTFLNSFFCILGTFNVHLICSHNKVHFCPADNLILSIIDNQPTSIDVHPHPSTNRRLLMFVHLFAVGRNKKQKQFIEFLTCLEFFSKK